MNILLFGLRCVGKTTVGLRLSDITDRVFFDTDYIIEKRESKRIPEIISEKGWDYFRIKEKEVIKDVSKEFSDSLYLGYEIYAKNRLIARIENGEVLVRYEKEVSDAGILQLYGHSYIHRDADVVSGNDIHDRRQASLCAAARAR